MAKTPTPQGVSAALRKAGFEKSVSSATRIKGWRNHSPGYVVRRGAEDGTVEVFHETGAFRMTDRDYANRDAEQARYKTALEAAGYSVGPDASWRGGLIVTAKAEG